VALKNRIKKIRAVVCDVDGVLTDGKIIYGSQGDEIKNFNVQDGLGLGALRKMGFKLAIISSRKSKVVAPRAKELRIDHVYVGVEPKMKAYEDLLKKIKMDDEEICFIGDDLADLRIMQRVGLAIAPANAVEDIKKVAHYITGKRGGDGAVREAAELILKSKGLWAKVLKES
jgi:3-deoxy-D-manno-octulosonate 8-phosphate phosphatase (KDO 8-P phosphatase)